jgi:hypothetical protein
MPTEMKQPADYGGVRSFRIEGQIRREQPEVQLGEMKLMAYVFDRAGALLGSAALDEKGHYSVAVRLSQPVGVELVVGPADMPQQIRSSSAYRKTFSTEDWKLEKDLFQIRFDTVLPVDVWRPWWPLRICVSGHVRKVSRQDGITHICPIPFVKVEIFDVDRESCAWPWLRKWWKLLLDRPVIRYPDLIKEPPVPVPPWPGPDPVTSLSIEPAFTSDSRQSALSLTPHLPSLEELYQAKALDPQPEPPIFHSVLGSAITASEISRIPEPSFTRVGEARLMDSNIASQLDKLTLTSKIPPWLIFPRCFYSTAEVCETTTDCNGYFNCCFKWWPFHFRRGRLRFDALPDIIVKITQVIDGVSTVVYMDPYTSTRWNVHNAHIDLFLDDENVVCGQSCTPQPQPDGKAVFYTRIGNDYVYDVDQVAGTYHGGGLSNVAYGYGLHVQAAMGKGLTEAADPFYYRLSIGPGRGADAGPFKPITGNLADTRVNKATFKSESYVLGPQVVKGEPALYEVRNMKDYYWYWPDLIGYWFTPTDVPDEGIYTVRLEIFDKNGVKLGSTDVDYRDGTVAPPAVLPTMPDHCDLVLHVDNVAPTITLDIPKAGTECGVVRFADVPFNINTSITQTNGRLYSWSLRYVKGLSMDEKHIDQESSPAGLLPLPRSRTNSSAIFTSGLTSTCAFALIVDAWSHIRNGYGWVYYQRLVNPVAVEKCG